MREITKTEFEILQEQCDILKINENKYVVKQYKSNLKSIPKPLGYLFLCIAKMPIFIILAIAIELKDFFLGLLGALKCYTYDYFKEEILFYLKRCSPIVIFKVKNKLDEEGKNE